MCTHDNLAVAHLVLAYDVVVGETVVANDLFLVRTVSEQPVSIGGYPELVSDTFHVLYVVEGSLRLREMRHFTRLGIEELECAVLGANP